MEEPKICKCKCHWDGKLIDHTGPFCCLNYDKKYISKNGEIDIKRYEEIKDG